MMDHQKTTHILLTIAVVGILFLIYLFMQERYFDKPNYQPVAVQEEPVYTLPTNNPPVATPLPTPTPTPSSTVPILTISNIEFSVGDQGVVGYAEDSNYPLYFLCENNSTNWRFSMSIDDEDCGTSDELIVQKYKLEVVLKSEQDKSQLDMLNSRYGISSIKFGSFYQLTLPENSPYNSLEISKAYFSTGYFNIVRPIQHQESDTY